MGLTREFTVIPKESKESTISPSMERVPVSDMII